MNNATARICQALLAAGFLILAAVYAVWTVLALFSVLAFGVVRWAWAQAGETVEKMK